MSNDALVNSVFGQYIIEQHLQSGGMATVYRATHQQRRFLVALKILKASYQRDPDVVERFKREAQVTQNLSHPHIVQCIDAGDFNGMSYIAMPYIEGGSIADMLKKGGTQIPLWRTAEWLFQIASALDYAHQQGVIHRDLKPGNILLDRNQKAYLTDFGIARVLEAARLTVPGTQMPGTVRYMSPEQARGVDITPLSDIYSLGVVAYIFSTGFYPFDGKNEPSILEQHLSALLPQPTRANPNLPSGLDGVLFKCLAKKPQDRYQTASEFAYAFRHAISGYEQVLVTIELKQKNPATVDNRPVTETKPPTALRRPDNFPAQPPPAPLPPPTPSPLPPMSGYPYMPPPKKRDNSNTVILIVIGIIVILVIIAVVLVIASNSGDTFSSTTF